jgi:mono/diheme cytochrome c family protein
MIRPVLALLLLLLGPGCSQQRDERPVPPTGQVVYLRHCASCHGSEGRGDGPVAASLSRAPSDLTTLARRSGGRFDESAVMAFIDGERLVAEHGPRDMPVWGAVFQREHSARHEPWPAYIALLEVRSLVDYLRSIQQP